MEEFRVAGRGDLPRLYALFREALALDTFSAELLAEKLFPVSPRPGDETRVLIADSPGGAGVSRGAGILPAEEPGGVGILPAMSGTARSAPPPPAPLLAAMQWTIRPTAGRAWLGLFAVARHARRRGVASRLLSRLRAETPTGASIEVLATPGNYFTPGLDPRYTAAHCFLERRGFARLPEKTCVNMRCALAAPFETAQAEAALAAHGIACRRASRGDEAAFDAFFSAQFGDDWRYEVAQGLRCDPPAVHVAIEDDQILGFAAHSTQNREWGFFGPMGSAPAARGKGVGRVLLMRCLNDLRAAGHASAVIPWVGPIAFYKQYVDADVERVFWRYSLTA